MNLLYSETDREDHVRGHEVGRLAEEIDRCAELSDVEDDLATVNVALQVAELAARCRS